LPCRIDLSGRRELYPVPSKGRKGGRGKTAATWHGVLLMIGLNEAFFVVRLSQPFPLGRPHLM